VKIRVYYEDTDAGGIVYHTNYIKYCERARSEAFFSKGLVPLEGEKSGFVVRKIDANFLASATLGDMLRVDTKIVTTKSSSITLLQEVWNKELKLFSMDILLVYVDSGKIRRIPEEFKKLFENIAKS
jgi:acyl-CoA thioester hydrolase